MKRFVYLDLIWIDTPISDMLIHKELVNYIKVDALPKSDKDKLTLRFERVEKFIKYLSDSEKNEFNLHPEYKESRLMYWEFMKNIEFNFHREREYIIGKQNLKRLLQKKDDNDNLTIADIAEIKNAKSS